MKVFVAIRSAAVVGTLVATAALSGCYVVPIQPTPQVIYAPALQPAQATFTARLYPSNHTASDYGMVGAIVTNDMNGRGRFSTTIGGESFNGEATRVAGSSRDGIANGAGSRGGFINCRYTMNSPTLGTGNCRHSNGATFTMHVGS